MIKQCYCGDEFVTYPSKIKIGRGKYCSKECCLAVTNHILEENGRATRFPIGQTPHNYQGYTTTQSRPGSPRYIQIYAPEHPNGNKDGYVREHRLIMEDILGRYLLEDEIVHHIDENGLNNCPSNLQVMTASEHTTHHLLIRHNS
jgi:hypothetical protein